MSRFARIGFIALFLLPAACQSQNSGGSAMTSDQLQAIQADFQKDNPNARVGVVTAVLPASSLVAVGYIDPADFAVNDIVSVVDPKGNVVANGTIDAIEAGKLEVKYTPAGKDSSAPVVGDLAVRALTP